VAASQPPHDNLPTRRQRPRLPATQSAREAPDSRSERNRRRRERSLERQFTWLFIVAVTATTLYLVSRTSIGLSLLRRHL
jgi:hypothetical protein